MVSFIDQHREAYGVEPICTELPIAPSNNYEYKAREANPGRLPERYQRDAWLEIEMRRVWEENFRVYGVRKVWKQLNREQFRIASTCRSGTQSAWLKRSMACSKPKSSGRVDHGRTWNRSNMQPWNGSTGSIIAGWWNQSATFHLQSSSRRIMMNLSVRLLRPDSH